MAFNILNIIDFRFSVFKMFSIILIYTSDCFKNRNLFDDVLGGLRWLLILQYLEQQIDPLLWAQRLADAWTGGDGSDKSQGAPAVVLFTSDLGWDIVGVCKKYQYSISENSTMKWKWRLTRTVISKWKGWALLMKSFVLILKFKIFQ